MVPTNWLALYYGERQIRNQKTSLKEEIIDKNIKLFLQKGYNATRVEDITNATNVSKSAFYCHFISKSQFLETIVDRYESTFTDQVIETVRSLLSDFLRKMKHSHKWITDFPHRNKDLCVGFRTIVAEMAGSGTEIEGEIKAMQAKYRALFKETLEQGRREGKIKDDLDIDLMVYVINSIHMGTLLEWYANFNDINGAQLALTYRDIALNGILK